MPCSAWTKTPLFSMYPLFVPPLSFEGGKNVVHVLLQ